MKYIPISLLCAWLHCILTSDMNYCNCYFKHHSRNSGISLKTPQPVNRQVTGLSQARSRQKSWHGRLFFLTYQLRFSCLSVRNHANNALPCQANSVVDLWVNDYWHGALHRSSALSTIAVKHLTYPQLSALQRWSATPIEVERHSYSIWAGHHVWCRTHK